MASTIVLITGKHIRSRVYAYVLTHSTGANSGIGFATSKVLVKASNTFHVIIASRSVEKAQAAQSEIEATGIKGTLSTIQLDVTDRKSIEAAAANVKEEFGRLDVLMNNAGVGSMGHDLQTGFKLCLETNVVGPAMISEAFRALLFKSKNPYSIYVSSGERTLLRNAAQVFTRPGYENVRGSGAYQVSKAALNMLVVLEAGEYGPKGLKVFALSPGFVVSNLRGKSEEARTGWGKAGDPEVSGQIVLDIVQGRRDANVGSLIHKDGVYPW
jgi:NAD(P)-dependent dehydrogenase (short-subunit alcohol dehydrogenase family)